MFRKAMLFLVCGAVLIAGLWWLFAGSHAELSWGAPWPKELEVEATAVERVLPGPRGAGEGDWARAAERARWKAYYMAQLRAAERLGGLQLDSRTEVRDLALASQSLEAVYRGTVGAAAERPGAARIERLGDSVRASVVVAIPGERLVSLRRAFLEALRSGKFSLSLPARPQILTAGLPQREARAPAAGPERDGPEPVARPRSTRQAKAPQVAAAPVTPHAESNRELPPAATGALLWLAGDSATFGAAPRIFDAAGNELGSVFDLPASRLAAGPPIAAASDLAGQSVWVGASPRRFEGRVTGGDIFLDERLERDEILLFREWLRSAKIAVVLDAEEG